MIKKALAKHFSLFWHPKVKELKRRASKSGKHLTPVQDNTDRIKPNDRLLMTIGRNENSRIPYFLEYYRKLGIQHFLFVDHLSDRPMAEALEGQSDVSLWRTEQGFSDSHYGVDWINALLGRYAVSHWVLTVDLDEFFVYPFMESRSYQELLAYHDDIEKPCMFAIQVDMYPDGPLASAKVPIGESPLLYAPFFDRAGYQYENGSDREVIVRGGPRFRMLGSKDILAAPLLNKTPLIKWRARYAYASRTHTAFPPFLNAPHQSFHVPTGALLHYKLIASDNKCPDESNDHNGHVFHNENSAKFINSQSLVESNLMTAGGWK